MTENPGEWGGWDDESLSGLLDHINNMEFHPMDWEDECNHMMQGGDLIINDVNVGGIKPPFFRTLLRRSLEANGWRW